MTAAVLIPRLGGILFQLWTIFETIMANAITAPMTRNRSCDDFILPLIRSINPSRYVASRPNAPSQEVFYAKLIPLNRDDEKQNGADANQRLK
jgi:hypothetical protein